MEKHTGHNLKYEGLGKFYCITCKTDIVVNANALKERERKQWVLNESIPFIVAKHTMLGGELLLLVDNGIQNAILDIGFGYIKYTESKGYEYSKTRPYKSITNIIRLNAPNIDNALKELQIYGDNVVIGGQVGLIREKYLSNLGRYHTLATLQPLKYKLQGETEKVIRKIELPYMAVEEGFKGKNIRVEELLKKNPRVWVQGK